MPLGQVKVHHVAHIAYPIRKDRVVKRPLIIARECGTLLDGHYSYTALRKFCAVYAPRIDVDDERKISGMGAGRLPELAKGQSFDKLIRVSDLTCVAGCRRAVAREGLLVGGSGGGVLEAVRRMQDDLQGKTAVAIIHDSGARYLGTVFDAAWVERELGATEAEVRAIAGLDSSRG